ncbi:MAG: CAP domain-containing protein [Planctomycetota bacterium]
MTRRPPAAALCALALLLPACGGGSSGGGPVVTGQRMSQGELAWAVQVLDLVNQERANAGLPALGWDDPAAQVAYDHGVDMDTRNFFAHQNPDGQEPWDRLTAAGIGWSAVGENIARGQPDPVSVMTAWMGSPGHRANILSAAFTRLGVGVHDAPGGPWWTQLFYTP